jgi:hypothetical protein
MNQQNGITYRKLPGMSAQGLRIWGLLFLTFGAVLNPKVQMLLSSNEVDFIFTSVGLILQLIHFCAIPIFTFLLVEGFTHTVSLKNYATRVGILAVIVQFPYNYAIYGKLFSFENIVTFRLNPVFGLLLGMVMLYFYRRYAGKTLKRIVLKIGLVIVGFLWAKMLRIEYGVAVVLLVPIFYFLRNKKLIMIFAGCIAMTLCGFLDIPEGASTYIRTASYIASAPVGFLMLHFYNGEPGEGNRYVNYAAYPVILVAICLLAKFAM